METLIVFENLETIRYIFKDSEGNEVIQFANPDQEDKTYSLDKATGQEMDAVSEQPLIEWLAENYKNYGATLEFITDKSSEGAQFVSGFGGVGALLRYKVNFEQLVEDSDDEYYDDSDDDFI